MVTERFVFDQLMFGTKDFIGKEMFESSASGNDVTLVNERRALAIVRYALTYYMDWTPEQMYERLTPQVLKALNLETIVKKRIRFPEELGRLIDCRYLVHLLYPKRIPYDMQASVEEYYERVLSGEFNRFKKNFFIGDAGLYRARVCMRRMLESVGRYTTTEELYEFMASPEGKKAIVRYKLQSALKEQEITPLELLHSTLPPEERNELAFHRLKFEQVNSQQKSNLRRQGKFIA